MPRLDIKLINNRKNFSAIQVQWTKLLEKSDAHSLFCSWEWLYNWWEMYAKTQDKLCILTLTEENELKAIAPFYIKQTKYTSELRFIGTGETEESEVCSECQDILCKKGYQSDVGNSIKQWLIQNQNLWDIIQFSLLHKSSITYQNLLTRFSNHEHPASWWYQLPLNQLKDNSDASIYLSSIERKRDKLFRSNHVEIVKIKTENELESAFEDLIQLHQNRWQEQNCLGAFSSEQFINVHKRVSKDFLILGNLAFYLLKVDGISKAALYNFRIGKTEYFYQSGFDQQFKKRLSLGAQLHLYAINDAIKHKLHVYDFMAGEQNSYKTLYGCETEQLVNITIFGKSLRGRLLLIFEYIKSTIKRFRHK